MAHATTLKTFTPSVDEVKYYVDRWKNPNNKEYIRFKCLEQVFSGRVHNRTTLFNKCVMLNLAYNCCGYVDYELIVSHLLEKLDENNRRKLEIGDKGIVDILRKVKTGEKSSTDLYVFTVLFCNHTNPNLFYGFSRPICRTLMILNQQDEFYKINKWQDFWNYDFLCTVMDAFREKYNLRGISKTHLDTMLRGVYTEHSKEINQQFNKK